jgi:hypothetical protein
VATPANSCRHDEDGLDEEEQVVEVILRHPAKLSVPLIQYLYCLKRCCATPRCGSPANHVRKKSVFLFNFHLLNFSSITEYIFFPFVVDSLHHSALPHSLYNISFPVKSVESLSPWSFGDPWLFRGSVIRVVPLSGFSVKGYKEGRLMYS